MKPGTRDLVLEGTRVKCAEGGNNPWATNYNQSEEFLQLNSAHRMTSTTNINRQNPFLFTFGSIFESEQSRLEQSLQDLLSRIDRPELDIPPPELLEANQTTGLMDAISGISNIGQILIDAVQENGQALRKKAEESIEKGQAWLEDPIGIIKYFKWAIGIIIGIIVTITVIILLCKCNLFLSTITIPLQAIRAVGSFLSDCLWTTRDAARAFRPPVVMAVELEERPRPSAPVTEEMLEQQI